MCATVTTVTAVANATTADAYANTCAIATTIIHKQMSQRII
jgi:hypothetical protein